MTGSPRFCQALALLVCGRLLELKFHWHHRRHQRLTRAAARHLDGMTQTLEHRVDLCARYGGRLRAARTALQQRRSHRAAAVTPGRRILDRHRRGFPEP